MAEALAHGADVNLVNDEDEGKTPLIQAVMGVSWSAARNESRGRRSICVFHFYVSMTQGRYEQHLCKLWRIFVKSAADVIVMSAVLSGLKVFTFIFQNDF